MTEKGPTIKQRYAVRRALKFCFGNANDADAEMVIEATEKYGFKLVPVEINDADK